MLERLDRGRRAARGRRGEPRAHLARRRADTGPRSRPRIATTEARRALAAAFASSEGPAFPADAAARAALAAADGYAALVRADAESTAELTARVAQAGGFVRRVPELSGRRARPRGSRARRRSGVPGRAERTPRTERTDDGTTSTNADTRTAPPPRSADEAIARARQHALAALAESALALRALVDAASLAATGAPSDAHAALAGASAWLDQIAEQLQAGAGRRGAPWLDAVAHVLDAEIARWETRGRDDPEARAVLRAFLGVREILWEFGLRPSARRAKRTRGARAVATASARGRVAARARPTAATRDARAAARSVRRAARRRRGSSASR